ncbi:hypothetical protein T484DRAFT_1883884 [Baffinella frigidus]|nr:hypothetical protein T484DRAFT_1883884 [Cryptophyta sp. CCMP2293]
MLAMRANDELEVRQGSHAGNVQGCWVEDGGGPVHLSGLGGMCVDDTTGRVWLCDRPSRSLLLLEITEFQLGQSAGDGRKIFGDCNDASKIHPPLVKLEASLATSKMGGRARGSRKLGAAVFCCMALNQALVACATAAKVLDTFDLALEDGVEASTVNIVTAIHRVAKTLSPVKDALAMRSDPSALKRACAGVVGNAPVAVGQRAAW